MQVIVMFERFARVVSAAARGRRASRGLRRRRLPRYDRTFILSRHVMLPDPISDAELDAILNRNRANGSVSMLRPMEIVVSRDYLLQVTRQSLTTLQSARQPDTEDDKQRRSADRSIQQRIDFMAWLSSQPEQIQLAIYPITAGITDDDVMDVLDDQDLWPF